MIQLIIGNKGSGKTKAMIDIINESAKTSAGNIVCIEKSMKMTYNINHAVRVIDVDDYCIRGYEMFYGFVCGILARDYDIVEVYIDGILKIGDGDAEGLGAMLGKLDEMTKDMRVLVTVSEGEENLPESVLHFPRVNHDEAE